MGSICEFCWLCLREYDRHHYAIYNVLGCPGLKNRKRDYFKSPIIKGLWYFFSLICALIIGCLLLAGFAVFGASYEVVVCYVNGHEETEEDAENNASVIIYNNESSVSKNKKDFKPNYFYVVLLVLAGLALQPLYLMFKMLVAIMECYRNFGCWFYLYAAN